MELSFTLADNPKWKRGKFDVCNLEITDKNVFYDDCKLYLDGNLYDGFLKTWSGKKLRSEDFFIQCINAYLRNDNGNFESFSDDWKVFDNLDSFKSLSREGGESLSSCLYWIYLA